MEPRGMTTEPIKGLYIPKYSIADYNFRLQNQSTLQCLNFLIVECWDVDNHIINGTTPTILAMPPNFACHSHEYLYRLSHSRLFTICDSL